MITSKSPPKVGCGMKRLNQDGIQVFNTHENNGSTVRVYENKNLLAEVWVNKRQGYKYLQTLNRSKYLISLEQQLLRHSITLSDIGLGVGVTASHSPLKPSNVVAALGCPS